MKSFVSFSALICKIIITIPVIAFLVFVTIENRSVNVDLNWSPFHAAETLSLPMLIFGAVVLGFLWGSLILWSNTFEMREDARANRKRIANLEARLDLQHVEYEKLKGKVAAQTEIENAPRLTGPEILP